MSVYEIGIIGFGGMAAHHVKTLIDDPRLRVRSVYDIDPRRAEVARGLGLGTVDSAEALLSDPQIAVVLVATPNNFHRDYAIEAMRRGKHVVCEKPVAMNSDELQQMIDVSAETGRILTIHQNRRRDPDYQMVRRTIDEGKIGKLFQIESRVQGSRGVPPGWRRHAVAGGGMLLDWGVHLIDQLLYMQPDAVVEVSAHLLHIKCAEVDDNFKLILRFADGLSALVEVDTCHFITLPRWYACGDRGTLQIDDWNCHGRVLTAREQSIEWEEEIVYTRAGPTKTMAPRAKETVQEETLEIPVADYTLFYKDLADTLDGTAPLAVKPEEAMRVMRVMEAAFRSQTDGGAVSVHI